MNNKLSANEAEALFLKSVENALDLYEAAIANFGTVQKHISLGLAEIALEELGKSFTCLTVFSVDSDSYDWNQFWKIWRNHKIKAHRGFFYEFFCRLSIEIPENIRYIPSKREVIPQEKEISFYVDFDKNLRKPIIPMTEIDNEELVNRICSVGGPLNAALEVKDRFCAGSYKYKCAFSDYAREVLEKQVYQQDVKDVLSALENGEQEYNKALKDILELFGRVNKI